MKKLLDELTYQRETAETIVIKIENGKPYMEELKSYLPILNQTIMVIFEMMQNPAIELKIDQSFVLQVLKDIIYGIENEDSVYLSDVLRYGLLEIYDYLETELQREDHNE